MFSQTSATRYMKYYKISAGLNFRKRTIENFKLIKDFNQSNRLLTVVTNK